MWPIVFQAMAISEVPVMVRWSYHAMRILLMKGERIFDGDFIIVARPTFFTVLYCILVPSENNESLQLGQGVRCVIRRYDGVRVREEYFARFSV